ncbi:MAG: metallophosphoesterase [Planctomycetia bacterium]
MSLAPERLLRHLRDAATHLRADRRRCGNVLHLDDAEDVLVGGDLHGNLDNLRRLLELAELDDHPKRHVVLQEFVHGSGRYPDASDTSHQLLDRLALLVCKHPDRLHLIPGNHELAEWTGRAVAKAGVALNRLFSEGVRFAYDDLADDFLQAYDVLISSMPLAVRTPNRVFISHSIPPLSKVDEFDVGILSTLGLANLEHDAQSSLYHLLWGRDVSSEAAERFASLVDADHLITGHIATEEGFFAPNPRQIILDCVGLPAAAVLFPAQSTLTHEDLRGRVTVWRRDDEDDDRS